MGVLRQIVKRTMSACLPAERWLVRGSASATAKPAISLTFDDGPDPVHTPLVLDELRQCGLTATFFVVGQRAADHPDLIRRIVSEGHRLGNHTWSHSEPRLTSARQFLDETQRTSDFLARFVDATPRLMRPPKGELTWEKLRGLWRAGYTVALWSVDPRDYQLGAISAMQTAAAATTWRAGDIVLLHDIRPAAASFLGTWRQQGRWETWASVSLDQWIHPRFHPHGEKPDSTSTEGRS